MAWVRPKHPPPRKSKADPVETLVPMLSYFSNRRVNPRPSSPTKHISLAVPISRDPIIRSLQQAQAQHAEEPIIVYEEEDEESEYQPQPRPIPHHRQLRVEQERSKRHIPQMVTQHRRKPSPPPPPRIVRQQPRVPSHERPRPAETVQEKVFPQPTRYPPYNEQVSSRAMSARWASATTPLDLR